MNRSTNYKLSTSNKTIFEIFKKLRSDNHLFDLELVAGGQKLQAHKFLLCALSPFLHKMLVGKDNRGSIRFNDITAFAMKAILKLVYEQRVEIPEADGMDIVAQVDKALKLFGIDCSVTRTNDRTRVYMLDVDNNQFTKMKKSLWTNLHKPDVTLYSQSGESIPVQFSVLYLHCRRYRNETSILHDAVDVLPETVSYAALMEAIQLIYNGKLKSNVDTKQLEKTFAFFGIGNYAKDTVRINDPRLRRSAPRIPADGILIEPIYPLADWDSPILNENSFETYHLYSDQVNNGTRSLLFPYAGYGSPASPDLFSLYNSAVMGADPIRVNGGALGQRYLPPNTAQNIDGSRTLPRNIHFASRLNGPAWNANENGPSNANGSIPTTIGFDDFVNVVNIGNEARSAGNRSATKMEEANGDDASRKFFNRFA